MQPGQASGGGEGAGCSGADQGYRLAGSLGGLYVSQGLAVQFWLIKALINN